MSDQDVVKHTKEPWVRRYSDRVTVPGDSDGSMSIAHCYSTMGHNCDANATRIVACVNACAGIPTAQLPGLAGEVRRLREALTKTTAACEAFAKWFDAWCPSNRCCASSGLPIHEKALKAIDKARAALAGGEK